MYIVTLLTYLNAKPEGKAATPENNVNLFEKLVSEMPPQLRNGSVLIEENDLRDYLTIFFGTTIFFFLVYMIMNIVLRCIEGEAFEKLGNDQKVWKTSSMATILHHVANISWLTYTMYYSCSSMNGEPYPTETGGTFTKIGSD